jgi:hypothetical protein
MKKRVIPFGLGKYLINIKMNELPQDIQEGLKKLYSNELEDAENIIILGDVNKWNNDKNK